MTGVVEHSNSAGWTLTEVRRVATAPTEGIEPAS
jgi:hypothetical protein